MTVVTYLDTLGVKNNLLQTHHSVHPGGAEADEVSLKSDLDDEYAETVIKEALDLILIDELKGSELLEAEKQR